MQKSVLHPTPAFMSTQKIQHTDPGSGSGAVTFATEDA